MNIRNVCIVAALTLIWIMLRESIQISTVVQGIVISIGCLYFSNRYFPLDKITDVNFLKLVLYPFYLIGQVYIFSILVVKMIIWGARVEIIELETKLESAALKAILGDSINLTPSTILLDLQEAKIPILWLRRQDDPESTEDADATIKDGFEKRLLNAQINVQKRESA